MRKVSITGIDCTGKTSVVKSLGAIYNAPTVHLTKCNNNVSSIAHALGGLVDKLAKVGEIQNSKIATGAAYFMHLIPYKFEENAKKNTDLLISDRDPIIDAVCYSNFYLPESLSKITNLSLKPFLESFFDYPDAFIYLDVSPEISVKRNNCSTQLHEKIDALSKLKKLFDEKMFLTEKMGIKINRINTDNKSLDEVIKEARIFLDKM